MSWQVPSLAASGQELKNMTTSLTRPPPPSMCLTCEVLVVFPSPQECKAASSLLLLDLYLKFHTPRRHPQDTTARRINTTKPHTTH